MIRKLVILMMSFVGLTMTSCAQNTKNTEMNNANRKILIAYFSRADENYGVGTITEGNTEIIAKMIAEKTGGDLFHIETVAPYPAEYNACIEVAKKELQADARPEIKGDVKVEDYDVIYIGYPNWWGEPPMALYSFIEKHDWSGKTVIPFITHEGSGFGGTDRKVAAACKGADSKPGLAVYGHVAQKERDNARNAVSEWLRQ